jgi:hypothetical protein
MARYQKLVNIDKLLGSYSACPRYWQQSVQDLPLQPGQWVKAGSNGPKGQFRGISKAGVILITWKRGL